LRGWSYHTAIIDLMASGEEQNVIIIGAGAAGLAAARELANARIAPLVVEARERIGGRIYTFRTDSDPTPIELGAEFVHGHSPDVFDIARTAGLEIVRAKWSPWHFTSEGKLEPGDSFNPVGEDKIWKKLGEFFDQNRGDISLKEFLDGTQISPGARKMIEGYVGGFHAAEMDKIGVRSLMKTERAADRIDGDRAFRLPGGYDSVVEYLWTEAEKHGTKLCLNSMVKRIRWVPKSVEITVANKNGAEKVLKGSSTIVTLPAGVLKAPSNNEGAVIFDPPLDLKREALEKIEMGAALRIIFHFKTKWWKPVLERLKPETEPLGFLFTPSEAVPVWWTDEPSDVPLLTGWAGGARALELSALSKEDLETLAIGAIARIFGVEEDHVRDQIRTVNYHNWQHDPYSLGAYIYMGLDGVDAPAELARSIDDTLFFAGEATNYQGHWGTVHGAIATGIRAAHEVIASKPSPKNA
jgi:monoamine oxidase